MPPHLLFAAAIVIVCSVCGTSAKIGGWDTVPNTQYHIQTDEGPERYFKYQTMSGQYRKEKRLQDGTVVGSYGWVDANGILRLRDYIADDKGYRIVRTKMVKVGVDTPIDNAISVAKKSPANSAAEIAAYQSNPQPKPAYLGQYQGEKNRYSTKPAPISYDEYLKQKNGYGSTPKPISLSDYLKEKQLASTMAPVVVSEFTPNVEVNNNGYPSTTAEPSTTERPTYESTTEPTTLYSTTPEYVRPVTFRPYFNLNALNAYGKKGYEDEGRYEAANSDYVPRYDGVSMTHNGFRYYLPRQYHEETSLPGDQRAGSFGYIDPFGIRRVIYYNTSPNSGFVHRKNNRYVGFQATPYDPRF
uniref:Cuticle protein 6 n=2 Tax=Lygus hesperus TaxID=30085 RepID=A0A0K8SZY6_LYGHE